MEIKKTWLIIGLIIIIAAVILRLGTPRNRWVCVRGQWLAQGKPHNAQPQKACRDEFSVEAELAELSSLVNESFFKKEDSPAAATSVLSEDNVKSDATSLLSETKSEKTLELIAPQPDEVMRSPYLISGRAQDDWFFEGVFSVSLIDEQGETLASGLALAQGDWIGADWANFLSELNFSISKPITGELLFSKVNSSASLEQEIHVSYPVRLEP
ncbi:MAG: Gmad2 immunoglobulin-like domain-containing protein [Patescibacteria group bacterium]|nr:Gmad2 immunoglobulin-like domain-containing protein [Patescibacteria group bacterium]